MITKTRHRVANRHGHQAEASIESTITNTRHRVGNRHGRQAGASMELHLTHTRPRAATRPRPHAGASQHRPTTPTRPPARTPSYCPLRSCPPRSASLPLLCRRGMGAAAASQLALGPLCPCRRPRTLLRESPHPRPGHPTIARGCPKMARPFCPVIIMRPSDGSGRTDGRANCDDEVGCQVTTQVVV